MIIWPVPHNIGVFKMKNSRLQFKNPKLLKLNYGLNTNFKNEGYINLDMKSKTSIKKGDSTAFVLLELKVFDNNSTVNVPFYIDISMEGQFFWDGGFNEKDIGKLLKSNGPAILLSYIRPYISNITVGAGFPPLILPLIDFTENECNIDRLD